MHENEQKLKLSTSNIIALIAVLISLGSGYIAVVSKLSELSQRINSLEKKDEDNKGGFVKFDLKLDKISESLNQLKVDMAGQRVIDAEKKHK